MRLCGRDENGSTWIHARRRRVHWRIVMPLFSVLYMLFVRGHAALNFATLSGLPPAPMTVGGGIGNAIVGTFVIVTIATLLSVPTGILSAVFLGEFGPDTKTAAVRGREHLRQRRSVFYRKKPTVPVIRAAELTGSGDAGRPSQGDFEAAFHTLQ